MWFTHGIYANVHPKKPKEGWDGGSQTYTLKRNCIENSKHIFQKWNCAGLFPIHVSVNNLYFIRIGLPILLQQNRWTDPVFIYLLIHYLSCYTFACFLSHQICSISLAVMLLLIGIVDAKIIYSCIPFRQLCLPFMKFFKHLYSICTKHCKVTCLHCRL